MQELDDFKQDVTKSSNEDWYRSLGSENKSCDLRRLTCLVCGDLLGYLTLESKGEIRNKRCIQSIKTSYPKGYLYQIFYQSRPSFTSTSYIEMLLEVILKTLIPCVLSTKLINMSI